MEKQNSNNALEKYPFAYRQFKNGKISITWNNKEVLILKGNRAEKFSDQILTANKSEAQMIMAKLTGNFKRGNERIAKSKGR